MIEDEAVADGPGRRECVGLGADRRLDRKNSTRSVRNSDWSAMFENVAKIVWMLRWRR